MSEWLNNQKKHSNNFRKLLKERIEKAHPRRELTADEAKRLSKLPSTTTVQKATAAKASTLLLRSSTIRVKAFVKMR